MDDDGTDTIIQYHRAMSYPDSDEDIRLRESDCEESEERANIMDNIPVHPDKYIARDDTEWIAHNSNVPGRMPRKFLTQIEIENLMKNLDEENFDDSDSEFENSILENNEIELDVSANFDEEADGLFSWKEVEGSEMINVLPFSSKSWIES
ncbi:uncharacterized protein TNCV_136121 [Trichonephila clavipes]|nr:uncharacterized protein TNCV_136121 [Trichonephila clavipes]